MNLIYCKNQGNMPLTEIYSTDDRKSTIKINFYNTKQAGDLVSVIF